MSKQAVYRKYTCGIYSKHWDAWATSKCC